MTQDVIRIRGARQNNLKDLDLDLPLGEFTVITGVSGSGKSSLAFDTIYAEGQRRYVETFSPYARQFLDRMDRPHVDRIDGIPPAIAIDQTNPVRTSRSTVGTMTELNDYLKLLFARAAELYCHGCGSPVTRDNPESILLNLSSGLQDGTSLLIVFPLQVPEIITDNDLAHFLAAQGYTRVHARHGDCVEVIQDRTRLTSQNRSRLIEDLEQALQRGHGHLLIYPLDEDRAPLAPWKYSAALHCARCDIDYRDPLPNSFSFNSPMGACPECRGFGRVIGIDWSLVVPDETKTLAEGAIKPFQTESAAECQEDVLHYARRRKVAVDVPWAVLPQADRQWLIEGEGKPNGKRWYGIRRFFDYLESKAYKMHIRVLLSKYRSYDECPVCHGARLRHEALDWRLGAKTEADNALPVEHRFRSDAMRFDDAVLHGLPGLHIHDLMGLPVERTRQFFEQLIPRQDMQQAADLLLTEIRSRLRYLCDVGLGYLTLDRQSRTLSGGEVQRINLTTALGTSLVNTLFVLDEPSIGLHSRDIHRVLGVLARLRDVGNSLLVVEHDPEIMLAADRLIDMGPGPGRAGGEIVGFGTPQQVQRLGKSKTARYLNGKEQVGADRHIEPPDQATTHLTVHGASEHNLKHIDVHFPLHRLVCVTGVSGSGKSTLVNNILYQGLIKLKGKPDQTPGRHHTLEGHALIDAVVLVDQAPIGKTSRANPASYVGALDGIRKLFAQTPLAKSRRYSAGTFSFNSGNGRCPTCGGTGFEHVEMQFLSDVYLRCPDCDGRRYRTPVLEVTLREYSIADVLAMTVDQAVEFFQDQPEIRLALDPLRAVGLGYLQLGQPVPTLSGGEAQRLKLAGHLSRKGRPKGHTLFLFDEPTTGLHFSDIAVLLAAFDRLLRAGHSLVVIEHNLDLIRAADWLIDLGPEGGDGGGHLVATGTPAQIKAHPTSHTGAALLRYEHALGQQTTSPLSAQAATPRTTRTWQIEVQNAREHNLKDLTVQIPHERLTVITGVSGSGKSTLAFDILFNEGQRRYLESLNAYARQFVQPAARADVDAVYGIPPTVAIEQRTSRGGYKSTVGTLTEIHHFLRLLFVKLGVQYCPDCELPIQPQAPEAITEQVLREWAGHQVSVFAPLVIARKGVYNELAKWASRKGYPMLRVDGELLPVHDWPGLDRYQEHHIDLPIGELRIRKGNAATLRGFVDKALDQGKGTLRIADVTSGEEQSFSTRRACPGCGSSFDEPDPRLFSYNSKHGWCPSCFGTGLEIAGFDATQSGEEDAWLSSQQRGEREHITCRQCSGSRLRAESLAVYFADWSIADYAACTVEEAIEVLDALELTPREHAIGGDVIKEILARLTFLKQVGLGYLNLERAAPTLSGGEAQRIRLAAQLGSNLRGVCYVLDEPTIGLHPRDNRLLLDTLQHLENKGNTVIVVEHDAETIQRAEHIVDMGPGAGVRGGRVVAQGRLDELLRNPRSITGQALARPLRHPLRGTRRSCHEVPMLLVKQAACHNLQGMDVTLPLSRLVCVTGVSGSGKSTLIREVLVRSLKKLLGASTAKRSGNRLTQHLHGCGGVENWQAIGRVLEVDQSPIGKTPRSCPATYVGIWDAIRRLYAAVPEANLRGYGPGRFSFNTAGGRCDACDGQGMKRIEMSFLPDVKVPCEVCGGRRFNRETLEIAFRAKSIGDLLQLPVDDAAAFFTAHPAIHRTLELLQQMGLGYLTLGQQSPTLSGGEAQRIKLVTELAKAKPIATGRSRQQPTLYVLDEPTVGLHMADVEKLIQVLHRLVDVGHSVIVVEHNLDVIAEADWVIDLGPEGGQAGGTIVAAGTPEDLVRAAGSSHTGRALKTFASFASV